MATIDAYEEKDTMVMNVTRGIIQTNMPSKKCGKESVIIKITGVLVDMLVELDSET